MRAMKEYNQAQKDGVDIKTLPPPPPMENPDLIQCKYCDRKFNEVAHEKHEKICQNVRNKPKPVSQKPGVKKEVQGQTGVNYRKKF